MKHWIGILVILLAGCSANTYQLAPEWAPLQQIVERDLPFVSDTAITTMGHNVYTVDLGSWLVRNPPGSPQFMSKMAHEQVHSIRQLDYGLYSWLFNYLTDDDFKWEEEKAGWEQEIRIARKYGIGRTDEQYAKILSEMYQEMVSYDDALIWVRTIH